MKTYRTLLFDIDYTLLDFDAEEDVALRALFAEHDFPFTPEFKATYKEVNLNLWTLFEEGKIAREELLHSRHTLVHRAHGREVDGAALEARYHHHLEQGFALIEGALELTHALKDRFDLYLVSNGVSSIQYNRLKNSGLHPLFKDVFVSEDTGYQKPMKEYFDYVFARIPNFSLEHALIIGDSLNADIKGGQQAGLDTCWFNPEAKPNQSGIVPTYEVRRLAELYEILGVAAEAVAVNTNHAEH